MTRYTLCSLYAPSCTKEEHLLWNIGAEHYRELVINIKAGCWHLMLWYKPAWKYVGQGLAYYLLTLSRWGILSLLWHNIKWSLPILPILQFTFLPLMWLLSTYRFYYKMIIQSRKWIVICDKVRRIGFQNAAETKLLKKKKSSLKCNNLFLSYIVL